VRLVRVDGDVEAGIGLMPAVFGLGADATPVNPSGEVEAARLDV
jgi:hypothetical protein